MIKALIMAGGSCQRMRASGVKTHKALRQVGGRTLLDHNLEYLHFYGIHDITLAVNESEHDLLSRVAGLPLIIEKKPLGTIGAAQELSENTQTLVVLYVDNLTDLNLTTFLRFHQRQNAVLTVASHDEPFRIPFGELELDGSRILAYKEKPVFPIPISSGLYVLSNRALRAIGPGEPIHAPELVNRLVQRGDYVAAFRHRAWWIDVNDENALALAEAALGPKPLLEELHS